ncbi:phosphate acetyltransferase [Campylobacter sp. 19-13652]|uniref:phosphate acetyltransferase n=1 Tax=Campylobacter sp. 19-13652 TaxID=2840180 RepID=UPI001C7539EF|nr:phosphate acetyltransferase [Campylobacter sp. 19-13652]BCX79588.1 phosphate acetyltransferase [Campylobacter sp. 19-13652]
MKNLYIISDLNLEEAKSALNSKFKNVGVYKVELTDVDKKHLKQGKEKEVMTRLIDEFDAFSTKFEATIVVGVAGFSVFEPLTLNLKIAKNLNTPIYDKDAADLNIINKNSKLLISAEIDEILNTTQEILTPARFENMLLKRAIEANSSVVLPESEDPRVIKAAAILLEKGIKIVLLGERVAIDTLANELGVDVSKAEIINPLTSEHTAKFGEKIYELRKHKGMELDKALALAKDRTYFATMLVQEGLVGAMVSGANTTTADTIRPALQIIKTDPKSPLVSGMFFMALEEEVLIYADCAITPNPDPDALAGIAISSYNTAKSFGINPRVAMLSYSTGESGTGASVDAVKAAAAKVRELAPDMALAAPIQYDAAVDMAVASKKMPNDPVAGKANVFIFPDLNCGNITYKAVQRSANALAIGPILQGLRKPVNDLSRGALVEDIVNTVIISAIQAKQ